jgi:hypothetical protein
MACVHFYLNDICHIITSDLNEKWGTKNFKKIKIEEKQIAFQNRRPTLQ